jgi:Fe-S-cluster-containing dehydrogenase component
MHKHGNNITMTNNARCIGCRLCQEACPYSVKDVFQEKAEYSIISFNEFDKPTHAVYRSTKELIPKGTASGAEISKKVGSTPPHRTLYQHTDYKSVRRDGVVEKCIFCEHRVKNGELPNCVVACPSSARTFGDLNDPDSAASKLLKKYKSSVLKPEAGTKPNIYYIRSFRPEKRA